MNCCISVRTAVLSIIAFLSVFRGATAAFNPGATRLKLRANPSLTCQQHTGQPVDWWILLKLPKGVKYIYVDSNTIKACSPNNCWASYTDLNAATSPLRRTLNQLADASSSHMIYNDEDDQGDEHFTFAHSKGSIGFNQQGGFWVQHSFPGYPAPPSKSAFSVVDKTHLIYGQHAFCLTLSSPAIDDIARIMQVAKPYIYSHKLSDQLKPTYPHVSALILGKFSKQRQLYSTRLWTKGLLNLTAVAKPGFLKVPLHEAGVEKNCNCSMQWETWRHGPSVMPSFCPPKSPLASVNIKSIQYTPTATYDSLLDHSKWGVSLSSRKSLVCLGDQNRAYSQQNRGGMFLCLKKKSLWTIFSSLVASTDSCLAKKKG